MRRRRTLARWEKGYARAARPGVFQRTFRAQTLALPQAPCSVWRQGREDARDREDDDEALARGGRGRSLLRDPVGGSPGGGPSPRRSAQAPRRWATAWAGPVQGPYPVGNPSAQPDQSFAFPDPAEGARDQTLRLVLRPDVWGREARLRISNAFGTRPLTLDGVHAGLQLGGAALVPGTNRPVLFSGRDRVTVPPGGEAWSDPVALPFAADPDAALLAGRKLAVSLHVVGSSGPMTWHAKALQTSYATAPGAGGHGADEDEAAFPYSTASWFFLDAVDMAVGAPTPVVVAFGDSITDGTASTMNGDDRWPDVLSRRLHAKAGNRVAVVNAGIGGNQVVGPAEYGPQKPFPGGPSAWPGSTAT